MINKLIDFSINNKLIVSIFVLFIIIAGIWSITKVPIDAVPDITNNQVQVITVAPSLSTEDIEKFVTYPIELGMGNLPGIKEVRSISRFGLSHVTLVFDDDMGTYKPRQLVDEKLQNIRQDIPEEFGIPFLGPISTGLGEIYQYTIDVEEEYKDKYNLQDLRSIQDWIVKRQMAMVPGVVEVNSSGGRIKQYEVAVDTEVLKSHDLSITDIFEALRKNNSNVGGAYIERNHKANFIRGEGLANSLDDIRKIKVENDKGIPVLIEDVAKVRFGNQVMYGGFTKDGTGESVAGMVLMLKGANSNDVIKSVKDRIEKIQKSLPEGVSIKPFLDRSNLINNTTSTVATNLIEGGLIVIFVLVLFLGNLRGGLIVASTIPISLLFAFIMMYVFDVWANLMSLGAIDFGIIVDGSVIIVESAVFAFIRQKDKYPEIKQKIKDKIVSEESKKMMNSAFFGQLIILIVFIPILGLEGIEGKMFKPMALTFSFAMIGAMILCLTYVPMVSSIFLKGEKKKDSFGDKIIAKVENIYRRILSSVLKYSKSSIIIALLLFLSSLFVFTRLGGEFIPQLDEGDIAFHVILQPGSSLSEAVDATTKVEKMLVDNFPEIERMVSRIGVSSTPTDPMPMDLADGLMILKPESEWETGRTKKELIEDIKEKLEVFPGLNYEFTQPIEMRFNELITGVRQDLAIKIFGEDLDLLASKAKEVSNLIQNIKGVDDLRVEATTGMPQIVIKYNREKLAQYDLDISEVNNYVQMAFAGTKAGIIYEGERRFDMVVRLDSANRTSIYDVQELYVRTGNESLISLDEIADINYKDSPMQISRDNTNRRVYVGINVRNRDIESLVEEIDVVLEENLNLPPGYYIRYGGAFENLERATNKLKILVPIALGLIFILIFFALKSFKDTFIIYFAIPFSAVGGIYSLWLRDLPFSISAGVGFIVLFGVSVLNGLVLLSGLNDLKDKDLSLHELIMKGTKRRIRPIMLTALTDILGFLPMALSTTAGAEVQRPLATVVIGGLITSTILTLFILPILYKWSSNMNLKLKGNSIATTTFLLCLFLPLNLFSQTERTISLDEAIQKSLSTYPAIQISTTEIEKQDEAGGASFSFGQTQIFTANEEFDANRLGIRTLVGINQNNIDLFGTGARSDFYNHKMSLASYNNELNKIIVEREVSLAWINARTLNQKYAKYKKILDLYNDMAKKQNKQLQNQDISQIDLLKLENQIIKVNSKLKSLEIEKKLAVDNLNSWIVDSLRYIPENNEPIIDITNIRDIESHPSLQTKKENIKVLESSLDMQGNRYLPTFNLTYKAINVQEITGLHSYQVGINVPLVYNQISSRYDSTEKELRISELELEKEKIELNRELNQSFKNYKISKNEYENTKKLLTNFSTLKNAAELSRKTGDISFSEYFSIILEYTKSEIELLDAEFNYYKSMLNLKYYNTKVR